MVKLKTGIRSDFECLMFESFGIISRKTLENETENLLRSCCFLAKKSVTWLFHFGHKDKPY